MDPAKFQVFKEEFRSEAIALARSIVAFIERWEKREAEVKTLTPEQDAEMSVISEVIDEALSKM